MHRSARDQTDLPFPHLNPSAQNGELFMALAQFAPLGIFHTDTRGSCLYLNDTCCHLLGIRREEALGTGWTEVLPQKDRRRLKNSWLNSLRKGQAVKDVVRITHKNGEARVLEGAATPLRDRLGNVTGFLGTICDVTQHTLAEQELIRLKTALEHGTARKSAQHEEMVQESALLSYSISHQLRAPLRAISGYARILLEDHQQRLEPEAGEKLGKIEANAVWMGELIDALLSYAQLGRRDAKPQLVNVERLVADTFRELAHMTQGRKVHLELGKIPPASADEQLLRLAVRNLLENALKFTRLREKAHIKVGSWRDGTELVLFLKDNGVGFDNRYRDRLFVPFERLHPPEAFEGTGMGLAMVQRIAQKHGGRVWAEGEPEAGSVFYLALPAEP